MHKVTRSRQSSRISNVNVTSMVVLATALLCSPVTAQTAPAPSDLPASTQSADPAAPPQTLTPQTAADDRAEADRDIVVTGSRITSSGFNAP
ncbi:MAG: hypothetical protein EOP67_60385, partial [Sphingomonas sp.]